jgi:glycosyltransferase involved in cell wall biosynthesis
MKEQTLEFSMIMKNESSCIEKCLASIKGEKCTIIDTGSTDNCIELARKFPNVTVYSGEDFKWRDDFAFSRNQSLEKCNGSWIYIIDCDEFLSEDAIPKIKEVINNAGDKKAFMVNCYDSPGKFSHHSIRLFKNKSGIKWEAPIHNYLNYVTDDVVDIIHYVGYSQAHVLDPERAFRILGKFVLNNPKCTREKFYLAREYFYKNDWKTALHFYEWYLENAYFSPEIVDCHIMEAHCYKNLGEHDKARESALKAINLNSNMREAWIILAELTGPGNSKRFNEISKSATNEGALFVR